jgi:hypothetical protein
MVTLSTKARILEARGYAYNFDRMMYVNRAARKAFSAEFVEDKSGDELQDRMSEPSDPTGRWQFYFNAPPSDAVQHELSVLLGQ